MKGKDIFLGLGYIGADLVEEAETAAFPKKAEQKKTGGHMRKLIGIVLAACLVFALAAAAYATNLFGLRELFRTAHRELPKAAVPYIQQETAAVQAEDWSCAITESLSDDSNVMATVTIRGGDKYIVAPTYVNPTDSVAEIGLSGDQTLEEYAESQGKKLLLVGARLAKIGEKEAAACSQRMQSISDTEMVILMEAARTAAAPGQNAVCQVYALEAGSEDVQRVELPFTLKEAPAKRDAMVYHPLNADAIPGMTMGDMTITQSDLGYNIQMPVTAAKQEDIPLTKIDGLTYGEGGYVLGDDGVWRFRATMCQGTLGDTLTVRCYGWDDQLIGEITFQREG